MVRTGDVATLFGVDLGAIDDFVASALPTDREKVAAAVADARAGRSYDVTFRVALGDGVTRWVRDRGWPCGRDGGGMLRGIMADATEQKAAEEQVALLNRELEHRTRNLLANVQAIANMTVRTSADLAAFADAFSARVGALSTTHALISGASRHADLVSILRAELAPYDSGEPGRVALSGPPVMLPERAAFSLGLVIHELATNASKYGALSSAAGRLGVSWTLGPGDGSDRLSLTWEEADGPPVERPTRSGFGTEMIDRLLGRGGAIEREFRPEGFVARIDFSLPQAAGEVATTLRRSI